MNPTINNIITFDANSSGHVDFMYTDEFAFFKWRVLDGNQTFVTESNLLRPSKSSNGVYSFLLSSNMLKNGKVYYLEIELFDANEISISRSVYTRFFVRSKPHFAIKLNNSENTTMDSNGAYILSVIDNNSLDIAITYAQNDIPTDIEMPESLQYFELFFYELDGDTETLVDQTGRNYLTDEPSDFKIDGLQDGKLYKIVAKGMTSDDRELTAEPFKVIISNSKVDVPNTNLVCKNNYHGGYIDIYLNVTLNLYRTDSEPKFTDNTYVDLTNNKLEYYDGLVINNNFSLYTKVRPTKANSELIRVSDNLIISYCKHNNKQFFKIDFYKNEENVKFLTNTIIADIQANNTRAIYDEFIIRMSRDNGKFTFIVSNADDNYILTKIERIIGFTISDPTIYSTDDDVVTTAIEEVIGKE